jgi:NAD(P)-dependent dehydrogenase (short-subunit alcohol dehydrogenase family)
MRSIAELMNLRGRRALLTGGAGHIGLAAAQALLELGASVAVVDQDAAACQARVRDLSRAGQVLGLACDLADEGQTRAMVRGAVDQLGGLDILIHCAAYVGTTRAPGWAVPLPQQTIEAWEQALRVNLTSAFAMTQEARPALEGSGRGAVIFIGSIYALVGPDQRLYEGTPMANPAAYAASKGGLLQLTRYLATTLAPRVRVNMISPGGVLRGQPEAFQQRYVERTPLRRMAREEDMKGAVAYLAGDASAYVTGQNLIVDGGWTAW